MIARKINWKCKTKNKWKFINGIKFQTLNVKYWNKIQPIIGIQIINKIEVKTITINNHVIITDWKIINHTYINKLKCKMKHWFSNFIQYILMMWLSRHIKN